METPRMGLAGPDYIQREMERFFEHIGRSKRPVCFFEKAWKPLCDVLENDSEVLIIAELAGVPAGRIDVKVEGTSLVISGDRPEPSSEANRAFCQMEISYGPFERTIQLPAQVDAESARASYEDGFLQVRLPKLKGRSRKEVDIDVSTE